ncbi:hypothetical protein [Streptococcus suis]
MNKSIRKRLEKLAEHADQGDIICFVFPDGNGAWYVEWNDSKTTNRKDGFQTVEKALEFAEGLNKVSNVFYHNREARDVVTIVDEWNGGNE